MRARWRFASRRRRSRCSRQVLPVKRRGVHEKAVEGVQALPRGRTLLITAMEEKDCPKFNPMTVVTGTCGSRTTGVAVPLGARLTFLLADLFPFFGAIVCVLLGVVDGPLAHFSCSRGESARNPPSRSFRRETLRRQVHHPPAPPGCQPDRRPPSRIALSSEQNAEPASLSPLIASLHHHPPPTARLRSYAQPVYSSSLDRRGVAATGGGRAAQVDVGPLLAQVHRGASRPHRFVARPIASREPRSLSSSPSER